MNTVRTERRLLRIVAALFLLWSAAFICRSSFVAVDGRRYFCLADDAMISMRYAWNLAHGDGLAWNPGERVEGITNFLMTLLMALSTAVFSKSAACLCIQVLGALEMLVIALLGRRVADEVFRDALERKRALIRTLAFTGILAYYPLAYWSLMGMETGLAAVVSMGMILAAVRYMARPSPGKACVGAVLLGLAFLTRPDSGVLAIAAFGLWGLLALRKDRRLWAHLLCAGAVYAIFVGGLTAFRLGYYGEVVPNTYTLKMTGMPLAERLRNGLAFTGPFLMESWVLLAVACVEVLCRFRREKLLLLTCIGGAVAYQVWTGGDAWTHWRMPASVIPLAIILFAGGAVGFASALLESQALRRYLLERPIMPERRALEWVACLGVLLAMIWVNARFGPEIALVARPAGAAGNYNNVNSAIALQELTTDEARVGVVWAGTIPYHTERRAVDLLGKNDKHIARLAADVSGDVGWRGMNSVPGHNKYDLDYSIKELKPDYVQRLRWGGQDITEWGRSHYVEVTWQGVKLLLLRSSAHVQWEKLGMPAPRAL